MITAPKFDRSTHVLISPWKAGITVPAKHHGDSISIFHLEIGILHISGHPVSGRAFHLGIVIFQISIVIFHISGGVGWDGVHCEGPWEPEIVGDCRVFA